MGNLGKAPDFSVHSWIESKWISFTIRESTNTGFLSCLEKTQCSIILLLLGHSENKPYAVQIFLHGHTVANNTPSLLKATGLVICTLTGR